jgi:hypothetical protein
VEIRSFETEHEELNRSNSHDVTPLQVVRSTAQLSRGSRVVHSRGPTDQERIADRGCS